MKKYSVRITTIVALAAAGVFVSGCTANADRPQNDSAPETSQNSSSGLEEGAWGELDTDGKPSMLFEASDNSGGGEYSGTDGCNQISGSYTIQDGTINLGMMASTKMACEGVDTWLSSGKSAKVSGDTITVFDETGSEIGTLDRVLDR